MALEPIDCTTHSREIEQEYQKVVRGTDDDTTWLIISPNGQKEYVPSSTGSDFSDFIQSFDDGKVEYGIARVSPPGSDVGKVILIGWCPDSAPMKPRASFASNFGTVANSVLQGYHVQVTARDEDDLNESDLLTKISNAAGARYSIQSNVSNASPSSSGYNAPVKKVFTPAVKKVEPPMKSEPVPHVRQEEKVPVNTTATPSTSNDGDDWDEPEIKERDFETNPLSGNKSTYQPIGKIDLKKVIAEETAKEDPRLVHKIDPKADIAHLKEESKEHRDQDLDNFLKQEKDHVPSSTAAIGGTKPPLVKSDFSRNDNSDKVIQGFKTEKSPAQLWAEKKMKQTQQNNDSNVSASITPESNEPESGVDHSDEMNIGDLKSRFENLGTENEKNTDSVPPVGKTAIIAPKTFGQPAANSEAPAKEEKKPFIPGNVGQRLPGMHAEVSEHEEEDNDDWDEDEDEEETPRRNLPPPVMETREAGLQAPLPPRRTEPEPEQEQEPEPVEEQEEQNEASTPSLPSRNIVPEPQPVEEAEEQEEIEEPSPALPSRGGVPPPPPQRAIQETEPEVANEAPWATAEYDYEAGEDNELTFAENDKIINIEFVDDDWWLGELESTGQKGLFPSNYVTLGN
ncbi:similar to Saccharomyces cerevisiae YCR088W ABP1 Actin-binding protein of the cortical actin cytoskeleton [Maudiozyma saulgeensis]|uniref:Actin-binding protein n=1 Tax=Maudiozyma saulgeensis TaxID=1789683 RepID=A0A1X7QY75_9SACH|nr:similar to Saccharomyces cerevisiae YCR088W ABP1 Actin-binding protein of the cortical actin cytoskeleton [Kazachstania saulgeensis]